MNTRKIWSRRPLSVPGKVTVAALLVVTLSYAAELLHLGLDPEVSIVVAVLALTTGLAASGWPFTPALSAFVAGLILINNPFLSFNLSLTSGPLHSFARSQDLFGDGSIVLLPTPGHAPGHVSVLVQMDGYQLLLVADALYTLRHMAVKQVQAIGLGRQAMAEQIDSIRRIQQLRVALPEMVIVPTHDHTDYYGRYLEPFLADGHLSPEERQQIAAYEKQLFAPGWRLAEAAMPRFLPPTANEQVGAVA